ncbi:MAG: HAD-IA family hydrolase [Candidatus Saccharimonadales bacterium]
MAGQDSETLVSIVVLLNDTNEFNFKCIDSILLQTYHNIELIIIATDNNQKIVQSITDTRERHQKLKFIDIESKENDYQAIIDGIKSSSGEYILFVRSADSISSDFVRSAVSSAKKNSSDIVIAETVTVQGSEKIIFNFANDLPFEQLVNEQCLEGLFDQRGENYIWYSFFGSMYSKRVIDLALPYFKTPSGNIRTYGRIWFSVVVWSLAIHASRIYGAYYYNIVDNGAEDIEMIRVEIGNVNEEFVSIINFLKKQEKYENFEQDLLSWMNLYSYNYREKINNLAESDKVKDKLTNLIKFGDSHWGETKPSRFYNVKTPFDNRLEVLKEKISEKNTDCVSFDIFDTLVVRPFLRPSDLFYLLDDDFKKLEGKFRLENFHSIRVKSEELIRQEKSDSEDVSIVQIYEMIQKEYKVEDYIANIMLEKELEYEIKYCYPRSTAKDLYDLAKYLGKKVLITSDMYLPKETIETILRECGYTEYSELYISSHHGMMKATQNLYKHIATNEQIIPGKTIHIGDNYESDVVAANNAGWRGIHFPRTVDVAHKIFDRIFGNDTEYARGYLGVSSAYAIAMNKYFDNPFRSFSEKSSFNCSPFFLGYFALGLSMLGFTKWMIGDIVNKDIQSIIFLSRDGYLPMKVFNLFRQKLNLSLRVNYLPTSRKASVPLSIFSEVNLAELKIFNYRGNMTDSILDSLKDVQKDYGENSLDNIDLTKVKRLQLAFEKTYKDFFKGKVGVMDIGYSGKPEQVFEKIFKKSIETYFIYSGNGEAERRLRGSVNIYSRLYRASLREKMISEIGPSCTGYQIIHDKVEPVFDTECNMSSFDKYVISDMQRGTLDFIRDYLELFGQNLDAMEMGDNRLAMQPLDYATVYPASIDREIFRGMVHEDQIAGDNTIDLFDVYYGNAEQIEKLTEQANHLKDELKSHQDIRRSARLFAGNIKRRIMRGKTDREV